MADQPNFVLVPDDPPARPSLPVARAGGVRATLRALVQAAASALPASRGSLPRATIHVAPPDDGATATRPRLVFAVDATASREPAWAAARQVTDALARALPGELDVALAVHGGGRVHTFTDFTSDPAPLRDRAAGIGCVAGMTRLLPILSTSLRHANVRVVVYIGDVFEERMSAGQALADAMGARATRLIVLHDTANPAARRDEEIFWDLAKRTGGCVLPFDAGAPGKLRDLLGAVAVYAVGGESLLRARRRTLPGAVMLLEHLRRDR